MLFYILAVFVAGLLVPSNDPRLLGGSTVNAGENKVLLSPFIIALQDSGWKYIDKIITGAFVLSAFSAATSDGELTQWFLSLLICNISLYLEPFPFLFIAVWPCSPLLCWNI